MRVGVCFLVKWSLVFLCVLGFNLSFAKIEALFSPKGKICEKLVEKINSTKKRIYVAMYMFTAKRLADALIEAKQNRGVDVQVVTDKTSVKYKWGKIDLLKENGIEVFVFNPKHKGNEKFRKKMHHKFALLDNCVCTGSYNWTRQADKENSENINFFDDANACKEYEIEFEKLKKVCKKIRIAKNKGESKEEENGLKNKIVNMLKRVRAKFS